jgi:hypothetical protein
MGMKLALLILFIIVLCLLFFLGGFLVAVTKGIAVKRTEEPALSEEEKRKREKAKREYENFLRYDGSLQG